MLPAFAISNPLRRLLCCLSVSLIVAAMLPVFGCGSGNTQTTISPPPAYSEIYEFGDSITYGDGATSADGATSLSLGYGNLMISDFNGHGTNFGVAGASSADESDVMLKNYNPPGEQ